MQLYHTTTSPYARLVRMVIAEKGLAERITLVDAKTRTPESPYYAINPSGRVPYLVRDNGEAMEDSGQICLYLDSLDGAPSLNLPPSHQDWAYGRLESYARSMVDGISVFLRETRRPETEQSPTILKHEAARAVRLADLWEREVAHPLMHGEPNMAQLLLIAALEVGQRSKIGDLEGGRPRLAEWARRLRQRPSVKSVLG